MRSSASLTLKLDERRRRIVFRAWHRALQEVDLILGNYVDSHIAQLNEKQLDELEYIMSFEDQDILNWVIGASVPENFEQNSVYYQLLSYPTATDLMR